MTREEAVAWMRQVNGRLYHTPERDDKPKAWVAVVPVPAAGTNSGQLIIALGESPMEAAGAAEAQWQTQWDHLSTLH